MLCANDVILPAQPNSQKFVVKYANSPHANPSHRQPIYLWTRTITVMEVTIKNHSFVWVVYSCSFLRYEKHGNDINVQSSLPSFFNNVSCLDDRYTLMSNRTMTRGSLKIKSQQLLSTDLSVKIVSTCQEVLLSKNTSKESRLHTPAPVKSVDSIFRLFRVFYKTVLFPQKQWQKFHS